MKDSTLRLLWALLAAPPSQPSRRLLKGYDDTDPSLLSSPSWLRLTIGQLGWSTSGTGVCPHKIMNVK